MSAINPTVAARAALAETTGQTDASWAPQAAANQPTPPTAQSGFECAPAEPVKLVPDAKTVSSLNPGADAMMQNVVIGAGQVTGNEAAGMKISALIGDQRKLAQQRPATLEALGSTLVAASQQGLSDADMKEWLGFDFKEAESAEEGKQLMETLGMELLTAAQAARHADMAAQLACTSGLPQDQVAAVLPQLMEAQGRINPMAMQQSAPSFYTPV